MWTKTYYGQSPGDLQNLKNGFAGRFLAHDKNITGPNVKWPSKLPSILIVGDSIIGNFCISKIIQEFKGIANVNLLQQPHHCKNINSWLDEWKIEEWNHYKCVFWFDGMHGFPERVTEPEWEKLTPILVDRIKKSIPNILWGTCTPVPPKVPQNSKNSVKGPNSSDQKLNNTSVVNRNITIKKLMQKLNIPVLDLYNVVISVIDIIQPDKTNIHFNKQGEILIGKYISEKLKELYFS